MQVWVAYSPLDRIASISRVRPGFAGISVLASSLLASAATPALAGGPHIVIDPGHGGFQEGATTTRGVQEKVLSLQIARQVKDVLQKVVSAKVSLTRDRDVLLPLSERVEFANRQKPDLFISIHTNSMPTKRLRQRTEGIETFFLSADASDEEAGRTAERENSESSRLPGAKANDALAFILADLARSEAHADSSRLAYAVQQKLIATTGAMNRGVRQAPLYVLMGVQAPAILVEVGFISHPDEGRRLEDPKYQLALAEAIADGVKVFLEQMVKVTGRTTFAQPLQ